jgi:ribosomal protein S18 acetylase RimI-like enzyme
MHDLVRPAIAVDQANRGLGHEQFTASGALFVRCRELPLLHDGNHVARAQAATNDDIDALLARMDVEFTHCRHRQIVCDPDTPAELEARLTLDGWDVDRTLFLLLTGAPRGATPRHAIRRVDGPADWDAYARLKRLDWRERAHRLGLGELPEVGEALVAAYRLKVPPTRYWLVLADAEPRGFLQSWEGTDGVGQVEDLFVEEPFRHRGLATALLHHGIADARAHGAAAITIVADATDTPKQMYARMGFEPIAVLRKYTRHAT